MLLLFSLLTAAVSATEPVLGADGKPVPGRAAARPAAAQGHQGPKEKAGLAPDVFIFRDVGQGPCRIFGGNQYGNKGEYKGRNMWQTCKDNANCAGYWQSAAETADKPPEFEVYCQTNASPCDQTDGATYDKTSDLMGNGETGNDFHCFAKDDRTKADKWMERRAHKLMGTRHVNRGDKTRKQFRDQARQAAENSGYRNQNDLLNRDQRRPMLRLAAWTGLDLTAGTDGRTKLNTIHDELTNAAPKTNMCTPEKGYNRTKQTRCLWVERAAQADNCDNSTTPKEFSDVKRNQLWCMQMRIELADKGLLN